MSVPSNECCTLCVAARSSGDAPVSKVSRTTEGEIRGRAVRWEWEGDGGKWMQFSKEYSLAMTDALDKKKNQVRFQDNFDNIHIATYQAIHGLYAPL